MPRKYSPNTATWKIFVALFLELPTDKYPYTIKNLTKGRAINLAQNLNGCQRYWAEKQGVPDAMLQRSAKAKALGEGDNAEWVVEISDSPKYTSKQRGWQTAWLAELAQQIHDTTPASREEEPTSEPPSNPMFPPPSSDDIFVKWLGGNKGNGGNGEK